MTKYPEKIPQSAPIDKFTFSLAMSNNVKLQVEEELNSIDSRIERIVNDVLLDGVPMIRFILQTSHDRKELKKFAKAVDRVADLIEHQDLLKNKLNIINHAQKDPSWFALTFGDFSDEIDKEIESINIVED